MLLLISITPLVELVEENDERLCLAILRKFYTPSFSEELLLFKDIPNFIIQNDFLKIFENINRKKCRLYTIEGNCENVVKALRTYTNDYFIVSDIHLTKNGYYIDFYNIKDTVLQNKVIPLIRNKIIDNLLKEI